MAFRRDLNRQSIPVMFNAVREGKKEINDKT